MADRRTGSNVLAILTACLLVALAVSIFRGYDINLKCAPIAANVNGLACVAFGVVLLWWVIGGGKEANAKTGRYKSGIGHESVSMTVIIVTAVIALLTLTGPEKCPPKGENWIESLLALTRSG